MELALIFARIFVIIFFIEFQIVVQRSHYILRIYICNINGLCMMRIMRIFAELLNLIRTYESDWKIFEYLKATFCGSPSSCDCKYHWPEFFRNRFLFNLLSNSMQMLISFRYFKIFIRAVRIKKRSTVSHLHDIFAETF